MARSAPALTVIAGAAALVVWIVSASPFAAIPSNAVVLLVGNCAFSYDAFRALGPDVRARIIPVAIENDALVEKVCPASLAELRRHDWRLRVLPERIACRRLTAAANHFFYVDQRGAGLPAFSIGGVLVPPRGEPFVFAQLGLSLRYSPTGTPLFAVRSDDPTRPRPPLDPERMTQTLGY